jgi:plastocyanin
VIVVRHNFQFRCVNDEDARWLYMASARHLQRRKTSESSVLINPWEVQMGKLFTILLFVILVVSGCGTQQALDRAEMDFGSAKVVEFTLETGIVDGRMAFVGNGGDIDGLINPDLVVQAGEAVRMTVIDGDGMPHDLSIPGLGVKTRRVSSKGAAAELGFMPSEDQVGSFVYFCTVSGHREAGMEGKLVLRPGAQNVSATSG